MTESAYCKNERASTTLGLTLSHLVNAWNGNQGNKIVAQHLVSSSPQSRNQRCFRYLDCFDGGQRTEGTIQPSGVARNRYWLRKWITGIESGRGISPSVDERLGRNPEATFKTVYLSSQFDRKTDCFDGGEVIQDHMSSEVVARQAFPLLSCTVADERGTATTFKAVCVTQTRMPEGFKLMLNQSQALSTPDNLVGGAVMRTIPTASSGLNHPTKGEVMPVMNRR